MNAGTAEAAAPVEVDFEAVKSGSQAGAADYDEYLTVDTSETETAAEAVAQGQDLDYYGGAEAESVKMGKGTTKVSL